ncbi:uncharacterized protein LOC144428380 [Styela clava]
MFSAIALNQHIYVLVGRTSFYRLNFVNVIATWEKLKSPLENHGNYPPMTLVDGEIWIVGGCGLSSTTTVEKYDSLRNQWTKKKSKNVKCDGPAVICMQDSWT